jgi:hypothetical protein
MGYSPYGIRFGQAVGSTDASGSMKHGKQSGCFENDNGFGFENNKEDENEKEF